MITLYKYEDKNKEEMKEKILKELEATEEELIIKENEIEVGLFKNKKYQFEVIKKDDIIKEVKIFIETLAQKLNLEIHSEIKQRENTINVMLVSNNNAILIGKDGKTLEAIQVLLNQCISNQVDNIKVIVDASNYKGKKVKNFEYEIKKIAKDVLRTKVAVKLDPMNSYNRRIVHNVVSSFEQLSSISEGEEPNRYVVISYKED